MQSLFQIRQLLASHSLVPRKAFGQNFLIDHNLIKKFVDAAAVGEADTVLEVGPGTGTLTEELLARGCRVVAAEIDRGLAALLREHFHANPRFTLVEGDCLQDKRTMAPALMAAVGDGPFRLVSNLPYGAATPVMSTLLIEHPLCTQLTVTIQREVADRLMAPHGSKDFGTLSVIAQVVAEVKLITIVPLECFWPRPEVTSAMISLTRRPTPPTPDVKGLANFVQSLFEKRRKQLGAVLGRTFPFPKGIEPTARAEALSIPQLIELFSAQPPSCLGAESAGGGA